MTVASANYSGGIGDKLLLALFGGETPYVRLEPGQILFANGDPSNDMYVVLEGALTIRNGPVVYEDVGPGGIVGEMGLVEAHLPTADPGRVPAAWVQQLQAQLGAVVQQLRVVVVRLQHHPLERLVRQVVGPRHAES